MNLNELQGNIGIRFHNPDLLRQALTHRSYINEHDDADMEDNERLEFLGDAILGFISGEMLFREFPVLPEGELTRLRAALVRTEALAELAADIDLGAQLRMGRGEDNSGGRARMTNLCATYEALVGALYLDQGLDAVRQFAIPRFAALLPRIMREALDKDARSRLQEWSQSQLGITPAYRSVAETGPDHEKQFIVEVVIGDFVQTTGIGKSKQAAAQAAALEALALIERGEVETG